MRITEVRIQNFKRFTDLVIEGIPSSAKLVLLIGSNGSGKSSVFDAFDYMSKPEKDAEKEKDNYYLKKEDLNPMIVFGLDKDIGKEAEPVKFIGRSSMRIVPRIAMSGLDFEKDILAKDKDAPKSLIDFDARFNFDAPRFPYRNRN
ncbi:MAG: AAA family ATPase [Saprospiraceae bacterium]